jgi:hypothetical protein
MAAQAQPARKAKPPALLKFSPNAAGQLTISAPFSVNLATFSSMHPEIAIQAETGTLRIVCTWEPNAQMEISVDGGAGHGLPGRISLASLTGQSPATIEVQVSPEQMARGPVYVQLLGSPFQHSTGVVHGTMVASMVAGGVVDADDQASSRHALQEGTLLTLSEANAMEEKLKANPQDWSTRLSLLAYYASSADLRMSKPQILEARRRHILWAIKNRAAAKDIFTLSDLRIGKEGPLADPQGLEEAEQAWRSEIADHAENNDVLQNAAAFFASSDPAFSERALLQAKSQSRHAIYWNVLLGRLYGIAMASGVDGAFTEHARGILKTSNEPALLAAAASELALPKVSLAAAPQPQIQYSAPKYLELAEESAMHAVSLAPENPYWLLPLLQVLSVEVETAKTPDQKMIAEKKVYGLFKKFDDMAVDPAQRVLLLPELANLAFNVKDDKAAKMYAMQAIDLASQQEDRTIEGIAVSAEAVHDANDVLGRIALRGGNVQQAKEDLLKAAATPGGGAMSSQGPRMTLAQALLDHGEREVVLQYLEKIKTLWKSGSVSLDGWIEAIRQGKSPRLNLVDMPRIISPRW